jgi:hypothetical protein
MKKEGGVSGINRWAIYSSTFPQIFYFFLKDPGPLNCKKNVFQRLTNSECSQIDSKNIPANFLLFLKDPGPLNCKKRFSVA